MSELSHLVRWLLKEHRNGVRYARDDFYEGKGTKRRDISDKMIGKMKSREQFLQTWSHGGSMETRYHCTYRSVAHVVGDLS